MVLLYGGSETFPGSILGFKVISEVEKLVVVEDTVTLKEVCDSTDWTEEFPVPGTGMISEVEVKLTVVSDRGQNKSVRVHMFA